MEQYIKVDTGKIKPCIVLGFPGYEIWFNDDHYRVALEKRICDVRDAIGKSPVMKLTDVLDEAWFRHKNMCAKTLVSEFDQLLTETISERSTI